MMSESPCIIDGEILSLFKGKEEKSTAEISQALGKLIQRPLIYRRLNALNRADVLVRRKWGNAVLWRFNHIIDPPANP